MQKFQDLLTQAAQLKEQQLKQQRKNFQALPQYLKSGLNYAKKYVQLRKQHYLVQKYISQKLKKQGNDHYLLQNYGQALSKYQQALSVFRYIHAKKYENLKDEDIIYENYNAEPQFKEEHQTHRVALYLNICSALTKMHKKEEALHSSEQALKINQSNPKIYYKKAQAFLQYINRDSSDIKLGFYYLNKAYELSNDQSILTQMHKIKKELDEERQKQKKWFKFMFDKNKQSKDQDQDGKNEIKNVKNEQMLKQSIEKEHNSLVENNSTHNTKDTKKSIQLDSNIKDFVDQVKATQNNDTTPYITQDKMIEKKNQQKQNKFKQQFQKFRQQNQDIKQKNIPQSEKLQKNKLQLKPYLIIPRDDRWLIKYQEDFIHKHGSIIYSILQLYNYSDLLIEFKSLLAKCLELKQAAITPLRDQNKLLEEKIQMYEKFVQWVKKHPVEKYKRYIERYDLQTKWIQGNRGRPLDEIFTKETVTDKKKSTQAENSKSRVNDFIDSVRQQANKNVSKEKSQNYKQSNQQRDKQNDFIEEMLQKQEQVRRSTQKTRKTLNKTSKTNETKNSKTYGFKQQWQCDQDETRKRVFQEKDKVPQNLKGFLQNYEDFPTYQLQSKEQKNHQKTKHSPNKKDDSESAQGNEREIVKENPFGFLKTFIVVLSLALVVKLFF